MLASLIMFSTIPTNDWNNRVIYLQDTVGKCISLKEKSKCQGKIKHLDFVQFIKILSYAFNLEEENVSCDQCLLDQYYTSELCEETYRGKMWQSMSSPYSCTWVSGADDLQWLIRRSPRYCHKKSPLPGYQGLSSLHNHQGMGRKQTQLIITALYLPL